MAIGYIVGSGGGSGVTSFEVTATKENVLAGTSTITSDSDDAVVEGTMPNIGKVTQTLGVNGSYTIPKGYHDGTGKVTQNLVTKAAQTYYAGTSDQTISSGRYLSGAQTIKKITQSGMSAANIKNGTTVTVNNGNTNVFSVTGTYTGTKHAISATAFRGFGLASSDYVPSEEATFTMPLAGVVYYGGVSAFYNGVGTGTVEIYKNGTLVDNRNGSDGYSVRGTMVNKSFTAAKNDVITVRATATAGSATLCMIQAVCIY